MGRMSILSGEQLQVDEVANNKKIRNRQDHSDETPVVVGLLPRDALPVMIVQLVVPEPLLGVDGGSIVEPENQVRDAVVQSKGQRHSDQE